MALGILLLAAGAAFAPDAYAVVTDIRATQRPGAELVDNTYDVADSDGAGIAVTIAVSTNGGVLHFTPGAWLSGAVGASLAPGVGKQVIWNFGTAFRIPPTHNAKDNIRRTT